MNAVLTIVALASIGVGAALAAFATAQALNLDGLVHKLRASASPRRRVIASIAGVAGVGAVCALLLGVGPNVFTGTFAGLTVWVGICTSFLCISYAAVSQSPAAAVGAVSKPQARETKQAA